MCDSGSPATDSYRSLFPSVSQAGLQYVFAAAFELGCALNSSLQLSQV
jgi:hypothetical protein